MKKIIESASAIKRSIPVNKTFTLVGGCFDLLHVGHLHLFDYASTLEDLLVVAVLSDENVRGYKQSGRPIINQLQRAKMIASIGVVDFAYISNVNPNGPETLELLKPNSVVFGEDISAEKVERWSVNLAIYSPHTKIRFLPRYCEEEISTSHIIQRIRHIGV